VSGFFLSESLLCRQGEKSTAASRRRPPLETRSLSGEFPKRELESGEFDLAIAAYFDVAPNGYRIRTVFSDRFVCVCAESNAYLKTKQTTGDYLERRYLQIEVPPGVFAPVDQYLQGKKKRRNISLRIGNFLTPPAILAKSDFVLTCPLSLAESYKEMYPLMVAELPLWLPSIETKMIWHEKINGILFTRGLGNVCREKRLSPRRARRSLLPLSPR
jgi:DNA-binding transcriptional LysR family regulator